MNQAIIAEGVTKRFDAEAVLQGLTLSIEAGTTTALLGSNGSGKSTFLRSLLQLIEIDSGSIHLFGQEIQSLRGRKLRNIRKQIGVIFQQHNLVPRLSALTNVLHGALGRCSLGQAWFQSFAPSHLREEAYHCLERVGLEAHASKSVQTLSGGQSQRVAVARALMQRPKILLADEPVASLDPEAGELIMELLRGCNQKEGVTLLFTSHHLEHALEYADRIIGLESGKVQIDDAPNAFSIEELRKLYE